MLRFATVAKMKGEPEWKFGRPFQKKKSKCFLM